MRRVNGGRWEWSPLPLLPSTRPVARYAGHRSHEAPPSGGPRPAFAPPTDPCVDAHLPPLVGHESAISQVRVVRVVPPSRRTAVGVQEAPAVPLVERVDPAPDQLPKLLGRLG